MHMQWLRLWHDMPNDPKWRTIARISQRPVSEVISLYVHLMVEASANENERGRTQGNNNEHLATALDVSEEAIDAIKNAMQGRVLDGDILTGWFTRQPKREDGSAERAKEWREKKKDERNRTQTNADEPKRRGEEIRKEEEKKEVSALPLSEPELSKYCIEGEVVKVTRKQRDEWEKAFPFIDIIEHLKSLDDHYAKLKVEGKDVTGWFFRIPHALAKSNEREKEFRGEGARI